MKRFLFLLFTAFILSNSAWSSPVDSMEAKNLAQTFYQLKYPEQARPIFEDISNSVGVEHFYIFNNTNGPGFVMVSGDDCAIPILGYSGANNCVGGKLPDNILSWLGYYDGTIGAAILNGEVATEEIAEQWNNLRDGNLPSAPKSVTSVNPLIATTWDQDAPFNNLCPGTGSNKALVGCVATAMAQLMKYYNWPVTGTGSNTYVCNDGTHNYGTLSANFGATTYDWNNMLNSYPYQNSGSPAQQNAVATLSYHCGVAVNMIYTPEWSGAYVTDAQVANWDPNYPTAEKALKNHFDYSSSLYGAFKQYYTDAQWISMLKNDLDQQHPLIYAGNDQNGEGGHCFLCDGYDNSNNFHFNWGWRGFCDGYFALTGLTPYSGGSGGGNYDYTYYQQAIFGAVPNGGVTPPNPTDCEYLHYPLPGSLDFYVLASGGGYVSGTNYYGDLAKADYFTYSGNGMVENLNVTFGAIDGVQGSITFTVWESNNGTPGNVIGSKTVTLASVYNTSVNQNFNYECVFDSPIAVNGDFFAGVDFTNAISPIGILTTSDGDAANTGWELLSDGQWVPYNSSSSWQMSLTHAIHPYVCPVTTPDPPVGGTGLNMYTDFLYTPNPLRQNTIAYVTTSVINMGNTAFTGNLRLALETNDGEHVQTIQQIPVTNPVAPNSYSQFNFSGNITAAPGFYNLILYYKPDGVSSWMTVGGDYNASYQNPKSVMVAYPDGIDDHTLNTAKLRPNPATDHFYLDMPNQTIDKVEIYSSTGQIVYSQKNILFGESIDISFLRSGVYFVRYETSERVGSMKLIVK